MGRMLGFFAWAVHVGPPASVRTPHPRACAQSGEDGPRPLGNPVHSTHSQIRHTKPHDVVRVACIGVWRFGFGGPALASYLGNLGIGYFLASTVNGTSGQIDGQSARGAATSKADER